MYMPPPFFNHKWKGFHKYAFCTYCFNFALYHFFLSILILVHLTYFIFMSVKEEETGITSQAFLNSFVFS